DDIEYLLDRSFNDYVKGKALIGSPESCAAIVENLRSIGVDELGCFLDFGVDAASVLASLPHLSDLKKRCEKPDPGGPSGGSRLAEDTQNQIDSTLPLSESQQGLWLMTKLASEANRAYMESTVLGMRGKLDVEQLKTALQTM